MPLTSVFETILCMSAVGGAVVLAVLPVRLGLKKAPKIYSYILWAAVLFRLLCPFAIPVEMRMPAPGEAAAPEQIEASSDPISAEAMPALTAALPSQDSPLAGPRGTFATDPTLPERAAANSAAIPEEIRTAEPERGAGSVRFDRETALKIGAAVWIAGAVLLILQNTVSLVRLKRRMIGATPLAGEEGVWLADHVDTAFVWGFLCPVIVLPSSLKGRARSYVIRHERTHIRRGDPVWRLFAFAALLVHWFNPLVWLAFRLSDKDMEMSCDEAVMRASEDDIRADYSETLLRFASADMSLGTALAFGEGETGSRVKNVMRYRKPALWVSMAAILVLVSSAAVFAVRPTAMDTRLPNTRYLIGPVLYDPVGGREAMLRDTYGGVELAGDGTLSLYVNEWNRWETLGASEACTEEAAALFASVRETTGVRFRTVTEARCVPAEEGDGGWLIACDGAGRVYLASVRLGEEEKVFWICSLKSAAPKPSLFSSVSVVQTGFYQRSLIHPVGRPVTTLANIRVDELGDYELVFFSAEQDETDVPGLALFERFDGGRAARLVCWSLADGMTVEKTEGGIDTSFAGGTFTAAFPDGTVLTAEVELPVKTKDFFGRVTSVSGGSVTFVNLPAPEEAVRPDDEQTKSELDKLIREQEAEAREMEARVSAEKNAQLARARAEQLREEQALIEEAARDAAEREALERKILEIEAERRKVQELLPQVEIEMEQYRQMKKSYAEQIKALKGQDPEKVLRLREKLEQKKAEADAVLTEINERFNRNLVRARELEAELEELRARLAAEENEPMTPTPAVSSATDSSDAAAGAWGWEDEAPSGDFNVSVATLLEERQAGREPIDLADRDVVFPLPEDADWSVSDKFGWIKRYGMDEYHFGIDLRCATGTDVLAYADGEVAVSGYHASYGNYVVIDHGGNLATLYAHLEKRLVEVGDTVEAGQPVGTVGLSGSAYAGGLHFEVLCDGAACDPSGFLPGME